MVVWCIAYTAVDCPPTRRLGSDYRKLTLEIPRSPQQGPKVVVGQHWPDGMSRQWLVGQQRSSWWTSSCDASQRWTFSPRYIEEGLTMTTSELSPGEDFTVNYPDTCRDTYVRVFGFQIPFPKKPLPQFMSQTHKSHFFFFPKTTSLWTKPHQVEQTTEFTFRAAITIRNKRKWWLLLTTRQKLPWKEV